jgi:hypothetical protein
MRIASDTQGIFAYLMMAILDPQKNVTIIREKLRQISQQQRVKVPINVSQKKIRRNC